MYTPLTDRARKVMELANQEAQRFNHEYIGPEHMLLGLVADGSGNAIAVLKTLHLDPQKIRIEIEKIIQPLADPVTTDRLLLTPRAKQVFAYAAEDARDFKHDAIGTEHLLFGLLREEHGVAGQVLMNSGLTLDETYYEITRLPAREPVSSVPQT
jgi:ATP-dependent Clp protease ATP-binding subunit ClpC